MEPYTGLLAGAHTRKLAKSPQPAAPPLVQAAEGHWHQKKANRPTEITPETGGNQKGRG